MREKSGIHLVYVTEYGDEWRNVTRHIVRTEREVEHFKSKEFTEETLKVHGIEDVGVEIHMDVSVDDLIDILTVSETVREFPELSVRIDGKGYETVDLGLGYSEVMEKVKTEEGFKWFCEKISAIHIPTRRKLYATFLSRVFTQLRLARGVEDSITMISDALHNLPRYLASDDSFLYFKDDYFWSDVRDCGVMDICLDLFLVEVQIHNAMKTASESIMNKWIVKFDDLKAVDAIEELAGSRGTSVYRPALYRELGFIIVETDLKKEMILGIHGVTECIEEPFGSLAGVVVDKIREL
jgi:hypothetical protein